MKLLSILFLSSLIVGQLGGIPVYQGAVLYVHDIFLSLLFIEGFVQYAITSTFKKPQLAVPIAIFIGVAVLSLLTNSGKFAVPSLEVSALYLIRWIFYAFIYVLVLQIYTKKELWAYGLYVAGMSIGLLGLAQFFLYPDLRNLYYLGWDPHFYRLFGTFLDPNFAGIFLVFTILLGLKLLENKKIWLLITLGELVATACLLLTYSRSSFLALIAGLTVFAILKKKLLIIVGIAIFIAAVIYIPKTPGSTLDLLRADSTFARVENWRQGLALIAGAPVFGHGFNTLRYLGPEEGQIVSKAAAGLDSSILFIGATTGIVGILAYAYLVFRMIRNAHGKFSAIYVASIAALGVHSLFVNSAFYAWVMIWMWILTGIVERTSGDK